MNYRVTSSPAVRARLYEGGMTPRFEDAATLARTMQADREKWGRVIREANIRAWSRRFHMILLFPQ